MKLRNSAYIFIGTAVILSILLIVMQFTKEVDRDLSDFIIIGLLLTGTGLAYELLASKFSSPRQKFIIGIGALGFVTLVWAELAVGVFGSPFAGS
jgi:galactitol-specific phosphotransferase system IIC component